MRMTALIAFVVAVHIGSASLAAQQPANGLPAATPFADLFAAKSKPPSAPRFLFPTPTPRLNQPSAGRPAQNSEVVCGLTLIPGDPNVDPGIRHEVPKDAPTFAIQSVDPKLCRRP